MTSKNILITGSSRGIGRAIALHLAAHGHNLAVNCIYNRKKLDSLMEELSSFPIKSCSFQGDMGNYDEAKAFYEAAVSSLGTIDAVINNAGISYVGLLQDMTPEQWNHVINTNLTSVFNLSRLAIPVMVSQKSGKIINISSMWGLCGASCEAAYSAAKGGVNAFTKALAKELAPSGIQVNAIACGAIDTDMNHCFSHEELQSLTDDIPAGRLGRPEEVARLVALLLEAPEYLTGEIIKMDGGFV